MNRPFLLFAGDSYYPAGGWSDYKDAFATEREALIAAANARGDWWQVVDLRELRVVASQDSAQEGRRFHT